MGLYRCGWAVLRPRRLVVTLNRVSAIPTPVNDSTMPGSRWLGLPTWLSDIALIPARLVIQFFKGRGGVWLARSVASVYLYCSPQSSPTGRKQLLDYLSALYKWYLKKNPKRVGEYPFLHEMSKVGGQQNQWLWLLQYLNGLPSKRKAQLAGLTVSIAARGFERRLKNGKAQRQGSPLTNLRWLLLATTNRCDQNCDGCYASRYLGNSDVPFSRLDYVVTEAERMSVHAVLMIGWGEPFYNKDDKTNLRRLARRHPGMLFIVFTNGIHIVEADLDSISDLGNVYLFLSLDGLEKTNDSRRGAGVFKKAAGTAAELKRRGIPFGISVTATSINYREITSPVFIDTVKYWGAIGVLYFRFAYYLDQTDERWLSLSPDQVREYSLLIARARSRQLMPLIDADEGEIRIGGCRARRGSLAYIDAVTGRIAPCLKLPFASESVNLYKNISKGRLSEILQSDHFQSFWQEFPESWQCSMDCRLEEVWCKALPS